MRKASDSGQSLYSLKNFRSTLWEHRWIWLIFGCYVVAAFITAWIVDSPNGIAIAIYKDVILIVLPWFMAWHFSRTLRGIKTKHPVRYVLDDLRHNPVTVRRMLYGVPIVVLFPVFYSIFSSMKAMISHIQPFSWDPTFANWDRMLHGGCAPWELLHPLLGYPLITSLISLVYNTWLLMMAMVLYWQVFSLRDPRLRMQFLLAFLLVWIFLGNVIATLLSSAGPCYFGMATGIEDPYLPLMTYLNEASKSYPVFSLPGQRYLSDVYKSGELQLGIGISAMPSIHVACAFLWMLLGLRTSRWAGIGFTVYFVLIFVGSIHLAWHYAVDGYVGILGAWLIWWGVGRFLRDQEFETTSAGVEASLR